MPPSRAMVLALCALLVPALAAAGEPPGASPPHPVPQGESVDVTLVELYAVATRRGGRPVQGLGEGDFRVRLGGRELPIAWVRQADEVPLLLGLLIDSSDSMAPVMSEARTAADRFLEQVLAEGDRALLVDVDTEARLVRPLTGDRSALAAAFDDLEVGGDTALYDAIALGVAELAKVPGRRALVALTDGRDVGSDESSRSCRRMARRAGVPVYFLSIAGSGTTSSSARHNLLLSAFARETGGDLYWIVSPDELGPAYASLEDELRNQYVLGVAPGRPLDDEELAEIEVDVRGHGGVTVRAARRGGG